MFQKRQVRVAAAFLYGGTYGILLGALFYGRYWAPRLGYAESEQIWICVQQLMAGMVSGVVFGLILGIKPRPWASWIGSLGFGVLGVYFLPLLLERLHFSKTITDGFSVGLVELMPYLGIFAGPKIWERIRKMWNAAE